MRYSIVFIFLSTLSIIIGCDTQPIGSTQTIIKVRVLVDVDESPIPNSRSYISAFASQKATDVFGPERLAQYEVLTDSTGSFELIIPREINEESVAKISMPYISDVSGRLTQFDGNSFTISSSDDVILEGESGDFGVTGESKAGQAYDFTIRLLR